MSAILEAAINAVKNSELSFCKFISANDSGETGGHQAGVYIPKRAISLIFDEPGVKGHNKVGEGLVKWHDGKEVQARFIYYGKGTRNEYRITRLGRNLKVGYLFILAKKDKKNYEAYILCEKKEIVSFLDLLGLNANEPYHLISKQKEAIFKPQARIIHTLGSELIKDSFAAIIELVKNSYDADAEIVEIKFYNLNKEDTAKIVIADDGHGMDYDTVENVWMVPGTTDKLDRKQSPGGRNFLGAKGIGRLATGRLGNNLILETTDDKKYTTTLKINWSLFSAHKFLDEVPFFINDENKGLPTGTTLTIENINNEWREEKTIRLLKKELRKLLSPVSIKKEKFEIFLDLNDCGIDEFKIYNGEIEPFPVLDYFDYRLWGKIEKNGKVKLSYRNGVDLRIPIDSISFDLSDKEKEIIYLNGDVSLDFRVFDRDPDSIDELIARSNLKDDKGNFMGKNETRRLLTELSGVGIYREGFRIRPYGDQGYDWLELDKDRVQNPSLKIGSDQVSGYIFIGNETESGLQEKSSREGLFENESYFSLINAVKLTLLELEDRRFAFRQKTGRGRQAGRIEETLANLFDFSRIENQINKILKDNKITDGSSRQIKEILEKEKIEKAKDLEKIQETLARYEGQVTLGKIVGVLMHEGRKPLKYIDEQAPRIQRWVDFLLKYNLLEKKEAIFSKDEIIQRLEGLKNEGKLLINLFNKVDPLAVRRRRFILKNDINKIIDQCITLFENEIRKEKIKIIRKYNRTYYFKGSDSDLYICLTNLFDNSIYWLSTQTKNRVITIDLSYEDNFLVMDFSDNGPGIKDEYIDMIFEPGFSTKTRGTGLGLSIAGESITRIGGKLKLIDNVKGSHFRIELQKGEIK